ncbi:hypothetical protein CQW23_01962 [Capsicum baccatum]|uniref:Ubiquitin-like protease family profile domain-containing protein n=1 Tax=Capsicum baccatum TaxID=33114 RepID=A0A2G2XQ79_CAPBA|nr:hypothetical protein CQW23_01962 [Capsicum baccatum]
MQSTNEIDVSGFVPDDFDYKDIGFHENRSKYRNDPTIMKKLRDAASVKGKKTASVKGKKTASVKGKKIVGMKYVIKTVPPHPLRFGISFNRNFATDVGYYVGKKVLNMFKETCFGVFVDMPKSNFQGQITKCLLMLECKQDNPNEFHVYVKGTVLKFTIFEFSLISGLNCTSNIENFQFLLSETDDAVVSYIEFNMVADGRYEQYSWGKISFNKLMNSLRQDFLVEKQLYRLGGMPHILNVWMYKCCSEVDKDIACRIGTGIPRICNWFVIRTKSKFEKFMNGMFSKYAYTNINPTVDELKCLQLPNYDGIDLKDSVNSTFPSTSCRQPIKFDQKGKMSAGSLLLDDFDDVTIPPPLGLLNRTKAKSDITLAPPSKRRKTNAKQKESVKDQDKIKGHPSVKEVNKASSGISNTITDPINEKAPHEPSLMDFGEQTPIAEQNPPAVESVDKRFDDIEALLKKHHEEMKKQHEEMMLAVKEKHDAPQKVVIEINSPNKDAEKNETHGDDLETPKEHPKDVPEMKSETEVKNATFQHSIDNTIDDFSSPEMIDNIIVGMSTPIVAMEVNSDDFSKKANLPDLSLRTANVEVPNEIRESIDNIIAGISTPVVAMKMKSVSPTKMNDNECQIHDTQFQSDLPEVELGKQDAIKTRAPRKRKRTTIFRSPFTTEFGSSCKGKESTTVDFPRKHSFDGYLISDEMLMGLIEEYCNEVALINIIKGFNIPATLSWYLVDEVYIPVNCDGNFHWVLVVISVKKRCIRVYDSILSSQPREPSHEIKSLSLMLPTYISYSGLLENTERTVWSSIKAYKNKMSTVAGDLNDTPFVVEYIEDIAKQVSGSLDCGVCVAAYAKFLSDQMQIPSSNHDAEYLQKRYATLL